MGDKTGIEWTAATRSGASWGERLIVWPLIVLIVAAAVLIGVVICGGLLWLAETIWRAVL